MDPHLWQNLFGLDVTVLEKIARTVLVYTFLVLGLRLAGKRELAQLNPFDLVVLLTLANTVQNAIIGPDNSVLGGVIGAATLLAVNYVVVRFLYRFPKLDQFVEGSPRTLIEQGRVLPECLASESITHPELESAAHKQGFACLEDIEKAVLEPGGAISFVGKKPSGEDVWRGELAGHLNELARQVSLLQQAVQDLSQANTRPAPRPQG